MNIKQELDTYFTANYKQLESTTRKIIRKYNRHLDAPAVLSATYIHLIGKQQDIIDFSKKNNKTIPHIIYAFVKQYLNKMICWNESQINRENDRLHNRSVKITNEDNDTSLDHYITFQQQDEIYTDEFIKGFQDSLKKIDQIAFQVYYYDGLDNAKDFAEHFNISVRGAYLTINHLKDMLRQYVNKKTIYN